MPVFHRILPYLLAPVIAVLTTALPVSATWADMATGTEAFAVKDYKRAFREFEAAWKTGDPRAAYNIGLMYDGGYGVGSSNMEAANWYRIAADKGVPEAQDILAGRYMRGVGVHRDTHKALELFILASSKGFAPSQYHLGVMYFSGLGPLKKDLVRAVELLTLSANAGHPPAQHALGELLRGHEDIEADPVLAWQWLAMAVDGGERSARRSLKKLGEEMSAVDLQRAQTEYQRIKAARQAAEKK
jgi:uncharacterized protein